jgi:hypothetical protein
VKTLAESCDRNVTGSLRLVDYITVNAQEWHLVAHYLASQRAGRCIAKIALLMLVEDHFLGAE